MIKETLLKIWNSRVGMTIISLIVGGVVSYLLAPEKIKIKVETEIEYVDKEVIKEVVKYIDREVIVEKEVKKIKRKITYPDGLVIEEEIYEENNTQIERIKEQYKTLLAQKELEFQQKYEGLKEHLRLKKFNVFGGYGISILSLTQEYLVGVTADVYGPFTLGVAFSSPTTLYLTAGLRF